MDYNLPIIHSTEKVATRRDKRPIQGLYEVVAYLPINERASINSRSDSEFEQAVKPLDRQANEKALD